MKALVLSVSCWSAVLSPLVAVEPPVLLKEIGRTVTYASSSPQHFTPVGAGGSSAVFFARRDASTLSLMGTDGTAAGTMVLHDFAHVESAPLPLVGAVAAAGTSVFFTVEGGGGHWQLWKTNGTVPGTVMVKSVEALDAYGYFAGTPSQIAALGNQVVFSAWSTGNGQEPWVSDGTAAGTYQLADVKPGMNAGTPESSNPDGLATGIGAVYFSANDGTHGVELWKTDGTPAGTVMVKDLRDGMQPSYPGGFTASNGLVYFTARGEATYGEPEQIYATTEVWRTDGTAAGTVRVHYESEEFSFGGFYPLGSQTVFIRPHRLQGNFGGAITETNGRFYITDGTAAGTSVHGITPNTTLSPRSVLGQFPDGSLLYVARGDGLFPNFNYRLALLSNGVPTEILQGDLASHAFLGGSFYGVVTRRYYPDTLWRYSPGTGLANLGTFSASPTLRAAGNKVYAEFTGPASAPVGIEPYRLQADGQLTLLGDLRPGSTTDFYQEGIPNTARVEVVNGTLVFPAIGESGYELWKSDGTQAGTTVLKELVPGSAGHNAGFDPTAPRFEAFQRVGQRLFFVRSLPAPSQEQELWVTDGTEAGTVLLVSRERAFLSSIQPWPGGVWWTEHDYQNDTNELWFSDGTAAGTAAQKTITLWSNPGDPVVSLGGTTYTTGYDGTDCWLWEIHPDPVRSRRVHNFRQPGDSTTFCRALVVTGGALHAFIERQVGAPDYFRHGEIWRMPAGGTPSLVTTLPGFSTLAGFSIGFPAGQSRIYFSYQDGTVNPETFATTTTLYRTDGTAAGTQPVAPFTADLFSAVTVGDRLYFPGNHDAAGLEIWTTDGLSAPVRLTGSLSPHPFLSSGTQPGALVKGGGGKVYFDASTVENDLVVRRFRRISGTTVEDFGELPEGNINYALAFPRATIWANDRLYSAAFTGNTGHELHWWSAPAPATPFSSWAGVQGLSGGNALPDADPDGDGMPNALEFYTGTLPGSRTSAAKPTFATEVIIGVPRQVISLRRMAGTGMTMTLESSVDLVNWHPDLTVAPDGTLAYHPSFKRLILKSRSGSEPETIEFLVNPPLGRVFVRFRVAE